MIREQATDSRAPRTETLRADLVVVGGGLAGTCCALTAARAGTNVILVQDRPVLGGNASSEVRLWVLGATSHMGNNNRWAREGGVIDELLVENTYRNPEGNPVIFDTLLLEKVMEEPNITLLLNAAVFEVHKSDPETIRGVRAFCAQNSTFYDLSAPLFCDASGDGIVAFAAGAAFRMGAESREEFGEGFAPTAEYGGLLGHSLYFYSKDAGKPVRFVPPGYALQDITKIPRYRRFNAREHGCQLWWIEYGGRLDTVHDTEKIKWELWKSCTACGTTSRTRATSRGGNHDARMGGADSGQAGRAAASRGITSCASRTLWSSARTPTRWPTAAGPFDLHPADGVFSEKPGCNQWHSKGLYQIPYRCLYSRNVKNLFLAGRIISVSHVAFGSSRVMGTSAYVGQAVGMAAALCTAEQSLPRELGAENRIAHLQGELLKTGQHIPGLALQDPWDWPCRLPWRYRAKCVCGNCRPTGRCCRSCIPAAQLLPLSPGKVPRLTLWVEAREKTTLTVELRRSSKPGNHTPDVTLETKQMPLHAGRQPVHLHFESEITSRCTPFCA
jgi:hypothetical protein